MTLKFSPIFFLIAFWILIHHFHIHGRFYDPHDLKQLKIRSHEYWMILAMTTALILAALGL